MFDRITLHELSVRRLGDVPHAALDVTFDGTFIYKRGLGSQLTCHVWVERPAASKDGRHWDHLSQFPILIPVVPHPLRTDGAPTFEPHLTRTEGGVTTRIGMVLEGHRVRVTAGGLRLRSPLWQGRYRLALSLVWGVDKRRGKPVPAGPPYRAPAPALRVVTTPVELETDCDFHPVPGIARLEAVLDIPDPDPQAARHVFRVGNTNLASLPYQMPGPTVLQGDLAPSYRLDYAGFPILSLSVYLAASLGRTFTVLSPDRAAGPLSPWIARLLRAARTLPLEGQIAAPVFSDDFIHNQGKKQLQASEKSAQLAKDAVAMAESASGNDDDPQAVVGLEGAVKFGLSRALRRDPNNLKAWAAGARYIGEAAQRRVDDEPEKTTWDYLLAFDLLVGLVLRLQSMERALSLPKENPFRLATEVAITLYYGSDVIRDLGTAAYQLSLPERVPLSYPRLDEAAETLVPRTSK